MEPTLNSTPLRSLAWRLLAVIVLLGLAWELRQTLVLLFGAVLAAVVLHVLTVPLRKLTPVAITSRW